MDRYGIGVGRLKPLLAFAGTKYVLQLHWPHALQPPRFREGSASEFVVSEVGIAVARLDNPAEPLFTGVGSAEFAWAHKLPASATSKGEPAPIRFPWDALGVAMQLAEFDALGKTEDWAKRSLSG